LEWPPWPEAAYIVANVWYVLSVLDTY
jgi:hypothetical protein